MAQLALDDYPGRYALANELHARPFPELAAPCRAVYLAIKQPANAADRDREADRAHLRALLDRYGAPHPPPDASHYSGPLGRAFLKWEMHTEFVTYTLFADGVSPRPFSGEMFALFPADWLAAAPGKVVTSCLVRIEEAEPSDAEARIARDLPQWFVGESLAVSRVVDGEAVVAADFRIDEHGHGRFAVLAVAGIGRRRLGRIVQRVLEVETYRAMALLTLPTGRRRLGRIVQRLLEIETYKCMAMLTLPLGREVAVAVARLDRELAELVAGMARETGREAETLDRLLKLSAEIEHLASDTAFRFGAAEAYETIVRQRIDVLREERIGGRQLFHEFMIRRFDPAMRTCRSAKERLAELSARAERAANLLRTRVDVNNQAQNVEVLHALNRRAAMQLRLQETVEGLSVVAISYYAVNLAAGVFAPLAGPAGLDKPTLLALLTVPVVLLVWLLVRRIRARLGHRSDPDHP
jgi:uncharacterized membrane-anchored protein